MTEGKAATLTAVDDPHDEIAIIKQRINDIVAGQHRSSMWYRNPSFITSLAAIFISVTTTAVSWYRTYQQDITSLQGQLAATLQQANALQLQAIDLAAKYKDDQPNLLRAATTFNAQNLILAKQAYTLARSLGSAASPVNLTTIAHALMQSNEVTLAEDLLRQAVLRAENSVEYGAALRVLGQLQYYNGQTSEAEATFKKALDTFKAFPKEAKSADYVNYHQAYTYYYWGQALVARDCRAAKERLTMSAQLLDRLSLPGQQQAGSTIAEVRRVMQMLAHCS